MNDRLAANVAEGPLSDASERKEYAPKKGELLRNYEITFRFLSVGCTITVGCKTIPFSTVKDGIDAFNAYVSDPISETQKWTKLFNEQE